LHIYILYTKKALLFTGQGKALTRYPQAKRACLRQNPAEDKPFLFF